MKQLIFCDFEITQGFRHQRNFTSEIIQIGAIKVDKDFNEIARFNRYIKPQENPYLNEYLMARTGISQYVIDQSDEFSVVLKEFEEWIGDTSQTSYILWGKEDIKTLQEEMIRKKYDGKLSITKYFNFHSYLQSKLGRVIGIKGTLETFNIKPKGTLHDALYDAINMKNIYIKTIVASDSVNKLWFEGKVSFIIKQFQIMVDYLKESGNEFEIDIRELNIFIQKCKLLLEVINSFTDEVRENKLLELKAEIEIMNTNIESKLVNCFKKDTMPLQYAIIKNQLPTAYASKNELLNNWVQISSKYKFFTEKKSSSYTAKFYHLRDLYKKVGDGAYAFYKD